MGTWPHSFKGTNTCTWVYREIKFSILISLIPEDNSFVEDDFPLIKISTEITVFCTKLYIARSRLIAIYVRPFTNARRNYSVELSLTQSTE